MVAHINVSFGSTNKSVFLFCAASGSGSAGFPVFLLGNLVGGVREKVFAEPKGFCFFLVHDRRWLVLKNMGNVRVVGVAKTEKRLI